MATNDREATDLVQLKVRCRERLRAQLEDSAKEAGHSLNSEIVKRLERSFEVPSSFGSLFGTAFGGQHTVRLLRIVGTMIADQEDRAGIQWDKDENRPSRYDINLLEVMDVCDEAKNARGLKGILSGLPNKKDPPLDG